MNAQCTTTQLEFQPYGPRNVTARFDGGRISSDAGALLLREVDTRLGLVDRVGKCFRDYRDPRVTEHSVRELVAQRIFALAMGYEDLNDHDELRQDSVLAMLVGKRDLIGKTRPRSRDRGYPLASSSTLNRLELGDADKAPTSRNKRIVGDLKALDRLFVDVFIESFDQAPKEIWLDLDATDDLLHGSQEQRFYHGYYKNYCYLPLYIFCGEHLLDAQLRPSNQDASAGSEAELTRIVGHIRQHWPATKIVIRADSGFCRDAILTWCENNRVDYVVGVARNDRLVQALDRELQQAKRACHKSGEAARVFKDFTYRTRETWSRERRVVGKAEYLPKGANPRFVVTSLSCERVAAQPLYEELYCARGDMENRIKEQQLGLFADRTSCSVFRANELRLKFSSLAYVLMHGLRRLGLTGTRFARAQCTTIRLKLFKVAARVRMTVRKVWLSFAESYPYQGDIVRILAQLRRHAAWVPPD